MSDLTNNSAVYWRFPTYPGDSFVMKATPSLALAPSFQDNQRHASPSHRQIKRKPTLLLATRPKRIPLLPCLSPQSPTPSSITRQPQKELKTRLKKYLSDIQSRIDGAHSLPATLKSLPLSPSLFASLPTHLIRKASQSTAPSHLGSTSRKQPRIENEILGIFLKNNGGYLDDSDDSDDEDTVTAEERFTRSRLPPSSSSSARHFGQLDSNHNHSNTKKSFLLPNRKEIA